LLKADTITLNNPASMRILRYRYRGALICNPVERGDRVDPRGGRQRRITNDDPQSLEALE
jgi:hypothetical protein